MAKEQKLSLRSAILININIMMGAGIFINTVELSKRAGFLGCFAYAIVGVLLLPLIISIAQMISLYPSGGFYTFGAQEINPFAGFISAWSYFVGKLGSTMLLIHTAMLLCQQIIPIIATINVFLLDSIILTIFIFLNMFNLQTGRAIQGWLMIFKIVPVIFVVLTGLFLINPTHFTIVPTQAVGLLWAIPLVLFTFLGFEAACSLSSKIENAKKNGPLVIFFSYAFVIGLYFFYQLLFYAAVGNQLIAQTSYLGAFPVLLAALLGKKAASFYFLQAILNLAIAASALGGSYGILYSNSWNLYILAERKHIFLPNLFRATNKNLIPYACVFAQGIICLLYLAITTGNQLSLQLTSVFGSIVAYTVSVIALGYARYYKRSKKSVWIIALALINCILLISTCIGNLFILGLWPLASFFGLLVFGIIMFVITSRDHSKFDGFKKSKNELE